MSDIILRSTKGSPLSNAEIDTNFSNLNSDKIQSGDTVAALTITSATISGGSISGITDLAIADGGTGASTAAGARTNLGLAIGTNVQAYSTHLASLVNAQKIAGNFVVGNGTTWTVQSGDTARTSLGLGSMATQNSTSVTITGGSISGITDLAIADGGTGASNAAGARTNLGLGTLATANTINNSNWSGTVLSIANGGTGANSAAGARINLGLDIFVTGMIMMWSGTIATIPSGWALCNGSNGTPDLRNRFIIGANTDTTGESTTSITGTATKSGGSKDAIVVAHTHTGSTSSSGNHSHTFPVRANQWGASTSNTTGGTGSTVGTVTTSAAGNHTHTLSVDSAGSSGTNANLPPYFALAFIMKL